MYRKLDGKDSIPGLVKSMTLEEKASIVTGASPFFTRGIDKYGIPPALLLDGGTGVNNLQLLMDFLPKAWAEVHQPGTEESGVAGDTWGIFTKVADPGSMTPEEQQVLDLAVQKILDLKPEGATIGCFPPGMLLGATWDPEAVYACAQALGREVNAHKIDMLLGTPNVNIHRDPLNGRLFEGYSEDPCLVSALAPEFVKGIQDEGVVANAKHYAANNQETGRLGVNEHIPVRALHEIYFPGFKACVEQGGVKTIMSAYNQINGKPCAMNHWLLTDVLRGLWGFSGFVVSDWGAAYDQVEAAAAGNDLVMPGPREYQCLVDAVNSGALSEADLDRCVENFLNVLVEMPVVKGRKYASIDSKFSQKGAYRAAAEGIVLLKNKAGALPLRKDQKVSFFGKRSKRLIESGGGSAQVWTKLSTNPYDSTVAKIGAGLVSFDSVEKDVQAVIVTVCARGQEGADRPDLEIEPEDREALAQAISAAKTAGKKVIVLLNISGPVSMVDWIDDVDAVICLFLPGMEGGRAAADIIFGDLNPSGKLPLTFPREYRDCPTYGNFPGEAGEVWYGEGIFVGYRYYDQKNVEPLFPFGHGLSYTTFAFSDLRVPPVVRLDAGEKVTVSVKVKNTGKVAGKEVVQVYLADEVSTLLKPVKELKAFKKVFLAPGEEKVVTLALGKADLASFDAAMNCWTTEPGAYRVLVGVSSADIRLTGQFVAECSNPYAFGPQATVSRLAEDPRAVEVVKKHTGLNLRDVLATEIILSPNLPFAVAWDQKFLPRLAKKTPAEKAAVLDAIYADFAGIDVSKPLGQPDSPFAHLDEIDLAF